MINEQTVTIDPGRILRPLTWLVTLVSGGVYALGMSQQWQDFALYLNQTGHSQGGHGPGR